ncbi:DNA ligase D [Bacillus rubiinfantis]|uniref:DNA ligase D n=1 Tax=Bacillus rubiinfantis TaxID=1499680 RepID=UPI0005A64C8D|nr:DNA ligase D [Bacillus rubiinfantis]
MKPMLPTLTFDKPERAGWLYEVKYDGFRAVLDWTEDDIQLTSRNERSLLPQFPEIRDFLLKYQNEIKPLLPIRLDGELVLLENPYKANFSKIQVRGRLRADKKIAEQVNTRPARYMAFDLLLLAGKPIHSLPFNKRKAKLKELFQILGLNRTADTNSKQLLQFVTAFEGFTEIWEKVVLYDGEGIVAKHEQSSWEEGKRTTKWLKYKNWKHVQCFVHSFDKTNGYFFVAVYKDESIYPIGQVLFGFKPEEKQALEQIIRQNQVNEDSQFIYVQPAICLEVKYLELYENQLREPHFHRFRLDLQPEDCNFTSFMFAQKNLPADLEITHPDKPLWDNLEISKSDYIYYLREIASNMMPFLENRLLTVIRYPHGMFGEAFYQKNCPDYAPEFVQTHIDDGINYIVCNNLKTLIWLGNQLAIEYHVPFQTIGSNGPSEIVFDLDPPSKEDFHLAVKAALLIKEVLDQLKLIAYIKTSGNKGLQIYLPLPDGEFTFSDTRLFTSFIAEYLISKDPDSFTIERMKKKRGNRLYVDYVQHSEGKTIIAPYSLRGNEHGGAATPLFWNEVSESLEPKHFTMQFVLQRLKQNGDPFQHYFETKKIQPFAPVLEILKQNSTK